MHCGMGLDDLHRLNLRQLKVLFTHVAKLYGVNAKKVRESKGTVQLNMKPNVPDRLSYLEHKNQVLSYGRRKSR